MRSACSTSSAPDNGHGGRWWTLRGRRNQRPPPAGTTEPPAEQEETRSPLTDSNRRPLLTMFASDTRVRAITRDAVSPPNKAGSVDEHASRDVAHVVCDLSVLCP